MYVNNIVSRVDTKANATVSKYAFGLTAQIMCITHFPKCVHSFKVVY